MTDPVVPLKRAAWEALERVHEDPAALSVARAAIDEAKRLAPDDPELALIEGWVVKREGQRSAESLSAREEAFDRAAAEFKRAIQLGLNGYSNVPWLAAVALCKMSHNFQAGFEVGPATIRELLAMDGAGQASRHYQKALFLREYKSEDENAARAEIERAITIERHWASLILRGALREKVQDFSGALSDHEEAVRLAPREPKPLLSRARVKLRLGFFPGAADDFAAAYEIDPPAQFEAWLKLGTTLTSAGRPKDALSAFEKALNCRDRAEGLIALQRAEAKEGLDDLEGALEDLEIAERAGATLFLPEIRARVERKIRNRRQDIAGGSPEITPCAIMKHVYLILMFTIKCGLREICLTPDPSVPVFPKVEFRGPDGSRRSGPGLYYSELEPVIRGLMALAEMIPADGTRQAGRFSLQAAGAVHDFELEVGPADGGKRYARVTLLA